MTGCVQPASIRSVPVPLRVPYFPCFCWSGRWGGWGSNPRPTDYEKHGPVHSAR